MRRDSRKGFCLFACFKFGFSFYFFDFFPPKKELKLLERTGLSSARPEFSVDGISSPTLPNFLTLFEETFSIWKNTVFGF